VEEVKIGDVVTIKAVVRKIIFDEKGKHYQVVIKGDTFNATTIEPEDIVE